MKGGLFEKSKELLKELEALGYAKDEVHFFFKDFLCSKSSQTFHFAF